MPSLSLTKRVQEQKKRAAEASQHNERELDDRERRVGEIRQRERAHRHRDDSRRRERNREREPEHERERERDRDRDRDREGASDGYRRKPRHYSRSRSPPRRRELRMKAVSEMFDSITSIHAAQCEAK
ncbi:MAG: hypothetical protein Q9159_000087 [Coniocarpon cinnabarinum]